MDPIIDKINDIEQAASKILDDAARTNRELDAAHEVRIKAADIEIDEETERQIRELQEQLQEKLMSEGKALDEDSGRTLEQLEAFFRENRQALIDAVFNSIIRK